MPYAERRIDPYAEHEGLLFGSLMTFVECSLGYAEWIRAEPKSFKGFYFLGSSLCSASTILNCHLETLATF